MTGLAPVALPAYLVDARGRCRRQSRLTSTKEFVMNTDLELEVVDLGDAKEVTMGSHGKAIEDNQALPTQPV